MLHELVVQDTQCIKHAKQNSGVSKANLSDPSKKPFPQPSFYIQIPMKTKCPSISHALRMLVPKLLKTYCNTFIHLRHRGHLISLPSIEYPEDAMLVSKQSG